MTAKIDISYSSGWLRGREVTIDESSGEQEIGPGLQFRVRASDIVAYHAAEKGVVVLWLRGEKERVALIGSLSSVDKIMDRLSLREVVEISGPSSKEQA